MKIGGISSSTLLETLDMLVDPSSLVKTERNWSTRCSAVPMLSLISWLLLFNGAMPMLSSLLDLVDFQKGLVFPF